MSVILVTNFQKSPNYWVSPPHLTFDFGDVMLRDLPNCIFIE